MRAEISGEQLLLLLFDGGGCLGGLCFGHPLLEFVHAAGGIHKFLLACVEWMAGIANAHDNDRFGRARLDHIAARAANFRVHILRMNICFHKMAAKNNTPE